MQVVGFRSKRIATTAFLCIATSLMSACQMQESISSDEGTHAPSSDASGLGPDLIMIHKGAETERIRVTATMPRVSRLHVPINIELHLMNGRKEVAVCDHDIDERDFFLKLTDGDGKTVQRTEYGHTHMVDPYTFNSNIGLSIFPSEDICRYYDLTKYFDISKPGFYRLDVLKTVRSIHGMRGNDETNLDILVDQIIFLVE